jgi:hypothetical protein
MLVTIRETGRIFNPPGSAIDLGGTPHKLSAKTRPEAIRATEAVSPLLVRSPLTDNVVFPGESAVSNSEISK